MNIKSFYTTVGVVFFLVFALHLARIIFSWSIVFGGLEIPMWVSGVVVVISAFLLYQGYKFKKKL